MSNDVEQRLARLERQLTDQRETIEAQQETIEAQRERLTQLEATNGGVPRVVVTDGGNVKVLGEISADGATGVHGKATGNGTTYGVRGEVTSNSGYGLFTPDDARIEGITELVNLGGSITGNTTIFDLLGRGHTIDDGAFSVSASPAEGTVTASDAEPGDSFGWSVGVSGNGSTVAVGARGRDVGGQDSAGKVYVYDLGATQNPETRVTSSNPGQGYNFGDSVDVSGNGLWVAVGEPQSDSAAADAGKVYLYDVTKSPPGEFSTTAGNASSGDTFGASVAVDQDASKVIVGAPRKNSNTGEAYLYEGGFGTETNLTADDGSSNDLFGDRVAISKDGSTAIVSAPARNSSTGKVYVYDLTANNPNDAETGITAGDAASDDSFGSAVAIDGTGSTAIVGASSKNSDTGKAYVYDLTANPPAETGITASDGASNDRFGISVGITDDSSTVAVGAHYDDSKIGKLYLYDLTANNPTTTETRIVPSDGKLDDFFAVDVALSGDGSTVVAGAPGKDLAATGAGRAYRYTPEINLPF